MHWPAPWCTSQIIPVWGELYLFWPAEIICIQRQYLKQFSCQITVSDPGNSPIFRTTHFSRNNGTGRASQILTEQNLNISLRLFCCFWHGLTVEFITITTIPHCSPGLASRGLTNFPPEQTLLTVLTPGSSWHSWHSWSPEILLWWQCRQHRLVSPGVLVFIGRQGVWTRRIHQQGEPHWHAL